MSEPAPIVLEIIKPPNGGQGLRIKMELSLGSAAAELLEHQKRTDGRVDFRAVARMLGCSHQVLYDKPELRNFYKARPRKPKFAAVSSRRRVKPTHPWDRDD